MSKLELELNIDTFKPGGINVDEAATSRVREGDKIGKVRLGFMICHY